ncbi:kinase-like domain-containing protein [Bisporella sp. PMI_857]|nr:kinase-like domain-containing protein [Bisporella sp. PMI_857]
MVPPKPAEEDAIPTQLLQQLSRTPYACSSLSPPLSCRLGNFVYRGILAQPIRTEDGATAKSIIIKHSTDSVSKIFEMFLLNSLANYSPYTTTAIVKPPRLYLYDRETNTQVLEDFSNTDGLRAILYSADAHKLLPSPSTATIGRHLGLWLRSFHTWASAPEQAALQAQMWQNDPMRKTKYIFTYDSVLKVLENYPELLEGHEKTSEGTTKDFERPSTEKADDYGLLHGDFWSGNILLPSGGWRETPLADGANKLFIIDWEFTQFGHRSCDLGQIVGDLYEQKIYRNLDTAISTMEGVIDGYGTLSNEMAFRTATYVGVHLISWYNRRPRKGPRVVPPEVIVAGLAVGRDFMVKGWERDKAFFQGSALAPLFAAR